MNVVIVCPYDILRAGLTDIVKRAMPDSAVRCFRSPEEISREEARNTPCFLVWHELVVNKTAFGRNSTIVTISPLTCLPEGEELSVFATVSEVRMVLERAMAATGLAAPKPKTSQLTDREKEIITLVALGQTNREIADKLFISMHTVITHRKNISQKLGIKTIAGITMYAMMQNLIPAEDQRITI